MLGRLQSQSQVEQQTLDQLNRTRKANEAVLDKCQEQKDAAKRSVQKYDKELEELADIAKTGKTDAAKTSLIQVQRHLQQVDVSETLVAQQASNGKDARQSVSEAVIAHSMADAVLLEQSLYQDVQKLAEQLAICEAEHQHHVHSHWHVEAGTPKGSAEECASHRERLHKMYAAAYAHIQRLKGKYEELAEDDACEKAAREEFQVQCEEIEDRLATIQKTFCSTHHSLHSTLDQNAKDLESLTNAMNQALEDAGSTLPVCKAGAGWQKYHSELVKIMSVLKRRPACTNCCKRPARSMC